jgi:hypothetical protein
MRTCAIEFSPVERMKKSWSGVFQKSVFVSFVVLLYENPFWATTGFNT